MEPLISRVRRQSQSRVLYCIWFAMAPIPLHTLATVIDIGTLTSRMCPQCPAYLSKKARGWIVAIAMLTYINLAAFPGMVVSAYLVGRAAGAYEDRMAAENRTVKGVMAADSPGLGGDLVMNETELNSTQINSLEPVVPAVLALDFWIRFSLGVVVVRAFTRWFINKDIRKRGLPINSMAQIEYSVDVIVWSSFMVLATYKLLHNGSDGTQLKKNGLSSFETTFVLQSISIFANAWLADIILRYLWMYVSRIIDSEFKSSLAFRLVSLLPQPEGECTDECAVCLSEDNAERCKMPCGHVFHRGCMVSWVRSSPDDAGVSCPLCRAAVASNGYDFDASQAQPQLGG